MIPALVRWAVENVLVVLLLAFVLAVVGGYAFWNINVEAYPDPAPAVVEVIAKYPGTSAEEVERQVTVPLEVTLAGMPHLKYTRSKSLFGLSHIRNQFEYGMDFQQAKLEVLNRLSLATLPEGVKPTLAPTSPTGEIFRYWVRNPRDSNGQEIYALRDLKSLQDWTLEREFRRINRIADVVSFGGELKRYEIQPDPERLRQYEISLSQLEEAIAKSNENAGGDFLLGDQTVQAVRGLGLIGGGQDPLVATLSMHSADEAARYLRSEEARRLHEIRRIILSTTNNVPVRVGDVVEGGRIDDSSRVSEAGTVIGHATRMGKVAVSRRVDLAHRSGSPEQAAWEEDADAVAGIVLLRKGEQSLPALADVKTVFHRINSEPGHLPPGVRLEVFNDRTQLINRTTETVRENLVIGLFLVTAVLLVFLNHVPSAVIVAVNIPLSLLFAFLMLFLRGKSANLLSLGAVDFGIIVDSSIIMVESIYRRLASDEGSDEPLAARVLHAADEVQRSLFYSTLIMVCALLPLFTMDGPEGQIFGPMADAYAFALAGALLLALTLSPVLARLMLRGVRHGGANFLVRAIQQFYRWQLGILLAWRKSVVAGFVVVVLATGAALPYLGREFMPALEEGNIYVRGTFPLNASLDEVARQAATARKLVQRFAEVDGVLSQVGRPDDGTDPTGFYNAELFIALAPHEAWPRSEPARGLARLWRRDRPLDKSELVGRMESLLNDSLVGVDWSFSQAIRDNVMETLSGVKGENSIKIFGPDLAELERLAKRAARALHGVYGLESIGVFNIMGQTNLELAIDREKCAAWNVNVADVQDVLATAVGGRPLTEMVEGERTFDLTLRWPERLRSSEEMILDIPVDVMNNRVVGPGETAREVGFALEGTSLPPPASSGTSYSSGANRLPRRRLRDLVSPPGDVSGTAGESFRREGASTIYREQGQRLIAVKFSVRNRDLASAVAEAQQKTAGIFQPPYRAIWSGEFQEMQDAVARLAMVACLALGMILVLLYLALRTVFDVLVVFSNVVVICLGGIWALILTGMNFNISAGVGFISILGVGMMNGLILVSAFNHRRAIGQPLAQALDEGLSERVRSLTLTPLTAIFGMLPAALSSRIGSETQRPLAVVVVGGMAMSLALLNLIPVLYSFYGNRQPPKLPIPYAEH